jgi:hypothetical protein
MLKGSHNSMSYLKPLNKWHRIFRFLFRCQTKTIEEQYNSGVRVFDISLFRKPNGKSCFKYDNVIYDAFSFYEPFSILNKKGDCYVRLTLDESKKDRNRKDINKIEDRFKWHCWTLQMIYPDIMFFGGYRKCDGKILFEFKDKLENDEYILIDFV